MHVLYPERMYDDDGVEREVFAPGTTIVMRDVERIEDLDQADCNDVEGLMVFRQWAPGSILQRFPKLRAVVRMGVGYDRVDRAWCAEHNVLVCNVPDYGTMEVADHAIALTLALRRGLILHHEAQRRPEPAEWVAMRHPLLRRFSAQRFGIIGLGRIGTAAALRAKALGFEVIFYDPLVSNGTDLAIGVRRVRTLDELLSQADVLSIHTPQTPETINLIGARELALLPQNAIVINTARGRIIDLDALEAALRSNHLAGAGLDVIPVEPPVEPIPNLLRAYRDREPWQEGRLIITPHSAFYTPEAWDDIRRKSAETMAAALGNLPQNVIDPTSY